VVDWSIFLHIGKSEGSCIFDFVTFHQVPPVYGLDATDPYVWNERVLDPAVKIVESYLQGQKPDGVEPLPVTERSKKNDLKIQHCDVCERMFVGDIQWHDHLQSKKHRRMLKRKQVL
jgi:tRNA dimethylallyltransferase